MMNDGFEMVSFCELNAINTGLVIVCKSVQGDILNNPVGSYNNRCYVKGDNKICLMFGIEKDGVKTKFYFTTSKSRHHFQLDNDINNYSKAINGELKPL